jgi:hypothetical protein
MLLLFVAMVPSASAMAIRLTAELTGVMFPATPVAAQASVRTAKTNSDVFMIFLLQGPLCVQRAIFHEVDIEIHLNLARSIHEECYWFMR